MQNEAFRLLFPAGICNDRKRNSVVLGFYMKICGLQGLSDVLHLLLQIMITVGIGVPTVITISRSKCNTSQLVICLY